MEQLTVSYGGLLYFDRTLGLLTQEALPPNLRMNYSIFESPGELFRRQSRHASFDVAEMSASTYIALRSRGDERMIAMPVFPSRNFRHSQIYVNRLAGIRSPEQLVGKRVGIVEYQMTAALWIRGFLSDDYGVKPEDIRWRTGGLRSPGFSERIRIELPDSIEIGAIPSGRFLEEMLESGDIDALFTFEPPLSYEPLDPECPVARLFPDFERVEQEYFVRTGIFPIMHLVVLRQSLYDQHPWLAVSLMNAFERAKEMGSRRLRATTGLAVGLPWLAAHLEAADAVFGGDPFPYGFEANRSILETMVRYSVEQHLSATAVDVADIFAPAALGEGA